MQVIREGIDGLALGLSGSSHLRTDLSRADHSAAWRREVEHDGLDLRICHGLSQSVRDAIRVDHPHAGLLNETCALCQHAHDWNHGDVAATFDRMEVLGLDAAVRSQGETRTGRAGMTKTSPACRKPP